MFLVRVLESLLELSLMVVMSGVIIFLIYRLFIKANSDFDMEEQIADGNVAVGILVCTILVSTAILLQKGLSASFGMYQLSISVPEGVTLPFWQIGLVTLSHLMLTVSIAVFTVSITLRLFCRLSRKSNPRMQLNEHLKCGNIAVGILLSAVIFIATYFVGEGVSSLTRALVPQPNIGTVEIMK